MSLTSTLSVSLLVLGSALIHASWNALLKTGRDKFTGMILMSCTSMAIAAVLLPFMAPLPRAAWPFLAVSSLVHLAYKSTLLLGYRTGDLSQVYPVARGTGPLLVALLSAPVAGQVLTGPQWAGVLLVSLGVWTLAVRRGGSWVPVGFALATGVAICAYTLADGLGVLRAADAASYSLWLFFWDGVPWLLIGLWRSWRAPHWLHMPREAWRGGILAGAISMVSYSLVLWAMRLGLIAPIAALRETGVIFAALIGHFLLGEPFGRRRLIAACVVAAGVLLLHLG